MNYCPYCNTPLEGNICPNCGSALNHPAPTQAANPGGKKVAVLILSFFVIILCITGFVVCLVESVPSNSDISSEMDGDSTTSGSTSSTPPIINRFPVLREETDEAETEDSEASDTTDTSDAATSEDADAKDADAVFETDLSLDELEDSPKYKAFTDKKLGITCEIPAHFTRLDVNNVPAFYAPDRTAYLLFQTEDNTSQADGHALLKALKKDYDDTEIYYEDADNGWFALSVVTQDICYYYKGIVDTRIHMFCFATPNKYVDVYSDYIEYIEDSFHMLTDSAPKDDIIVADIEAQVNIIRAYYEDTEKKIEASALPSRQLTDNAIGYYDKGKLVRLDIAPDEACAYTRLYYFHNNSLYFAFIFSGTQENRMYFHNQKLFRWIDENGKTHDHPTTHELFLKWQTFALNDVSVVFNAQ